MENMTEHLNKVREERLAREKARIEKLRELNLKKYSKPSEPPKNSTSNVSLTKKPVKSETNIKNTNGVVKNNFHVNGTTKRPISAPLTKPQTKHATEPKEIKSNKSHTMNSIPENKISNNITEQKPLNTTHIKGPSNKSFGNKTMPNFRSTFTMGQTNKLEKKPLPVSSKQSTANKNLSRKSFAATEKPKPNVTRKSLAPPKPPQSITKSNTSFNNSVFERLYQHKTTQSTHITCTNASKLKTDPDYLKKCIRTTGLILNKRHTVFETKPKVQLPVRRSISAVHFKRIGKNELGNCIHKWASIGDKLNKVHLQHINEDETVIEDKVVSAVKSERKKVKFMTPITNFNTPRPEELQARLKSWLQKRGKSLDSYHHLQCFGIHHLPHRLRFEPKLYDDENKENIAVESDSDNESYTDNMNAEAEDVVENMDNKWRRASIVSDSVDFNETQNSATTCSDVINTDDILIGALNDLTELLREGFDWEQCARWLRAIRERFPSAPACAAYWECRAALEERRGDLPASVQCWEEAIAKGTEQSVVEANLDQLLDKFMQLKISPNSGKSRKQVDPKLVDVKNVFKSTIIRFAVQQAKLQQSKQHTPAKLCVTPVRRSARLSTHWSGKRTPLQVCSSVRQADELTGQKLLFVPNQNLNGTP